MTGFSMRGAKTVESHEDSCCGSAHQSRPDWFLWSVLLLVAAFSLWGLFFAGAVHEGALSIFSHSVAELLGKMWWGIAIGVVFVGILGTMPRDLVMSVLGHEAGWGSLLRATAAGVMLDLCSHGILAVGMKLYERGASVGQVMAFLLASPWNSFSLTLILFGLIGVGWTLLFIGLSLVIGLLTGAIFDLFVRRQVLPDNPHRIGLGQSAGLGSEWRQFRQGWSFSIDGAVRLLADGIRGSRVVIRWALFGILLASLIRVLMPEESFGVWFGATASGLGLTLLAATLIEVCSEGTTPIAADLLNRAGAPGNAFTFLMAGVSTDYTEIMSIRDTTGSWKLALFLPLISLPQILLLGWILNHFST